MHLCPATGLAADRIRLRSWLARAGREQRIFDIVNDSMPGRYKAKLENRSWADGASREGKALEEFRRDRKR